jgi:hypothetical protein
MLLSEFYVGLQHAGFVDSGFRHTVSTHECRSYDTPEHLRSVLAFVNIGVAGDTPAVSFQDANFRELGVWYEGGSKTPSILVTCSPDAETLRILSRDAESISFWLDSRPLFKMNIASDSETRDGVGTRLGILDVSEKADDGRL